MRQSRIVIPLASIAIALAQPAAARAQATTIVLRSVEPFDFSSTNPCTGEPVVLSGELKITERITVDNQGKTHNAFTLVPSSVRGEGDDGTQYKAVGGQHEHFNVVTPNDSAINDTFTETFNLISAGATDNFYAHTTFHVTITGDGTTRVELERISEECPG